MSIHLWIIALTAFSVAASSARLKAADGMDPATQDPLSRGTFSLYFENDAFGGTDQYYTNGTRLAWTTADLEKFSDNPFTGPFSGSLDELPYINEPGYQRNVAFTLGQAIFTPEDIAITSLIEDDRPYAGWLYTGLGLIWKNERIRHTLSLNLGVVGPWSFAEETQNLVHELRNIPRAQGWHHQLENEFGIILAYEAMWRWPRYATRSGFDWELLPFAGAALGNVDTSAHAGAELRFGWNLPDNFGTATINPAATTTTPLEGRQRARRPGRAKFGGHFFLRGEGRAVARNIFLDGNTFTDSHSVSKEPFVGDLSAGVSLNYKDLTLTYAWVYRTKEFKLQDEGQTFGSITLSIPF